MLDRELPEDDRQHITETILTGLRVRAIHDLRTRKAGDRNFVEVHPEVEGHLTVVEGHAVGDTAEEATGTLLTGIVQATAHPEPFGIKDEWLDDRVNEATAD